MDWNSIETNGEESERLVHLEKLHNASSDRKAVSAVARSIPPCCSGLKDPYRFILIPWTYWVSKTELKTLAEAMFGGKTLVRYRYV